MKFTFFCSGVFSCGLRAMGGLEFLEVNIRRTVKCMFNVCARVGSSGVGMVWGRWSRSGGGKPTPPPPKKNPSRPLLRPLVGSCPPPLPSFGRHPPPSSLFPKCYSRPPSILKVFAAAIPSTLAATPPSPLLQVSFFLVGSSSCGCKFYWRIGGRKEGGKRWNSR
jgi:hypothetical protein